jgi:hypothetical protein
LKQDYCPPLEGGAQVLSDWQGEDYKTSPCPLQRGTSMVLRIVSNILK